MLRLEIENHSSGVNRKIPQTQLYIASHDDDAKNDDQYSFEKSFAKILFRNSMDVFVWVCYGGLFLVLLLRTFGDANNYQGIDFGIRRRSRKSWGLISSERIFQTEQGVGVLGNRFIACRFVRPSNCFVTNKVQYSSHTYSNKLPPTTP